MRLNFLRAVNESVRRLANTDGSQGTFPTADKVAYKMAYTKTKRPEGRMFTRYLAERVSA